MISKSKKIIFSFVFIILVCWSINEIRFINRVKLLVPIEHEGYILLREDIYGKGYFGAKRNGNRKHNGIDILADMGAPVLATRSGYVINAEYKRGIGKYVEIKHSKKLLSIYGHLSEILVRKGQRVRQGEIIGTVGKTGNANYQRMNPHLHFEIRENNIPQDPGKYFKDVTFKKE